MPDPISWGFAWPYLLAALVGGYLIGSIPFGLLLTRAAGYGDIRRIGSGNIGTTNVLRTGNRWLALATLLLDGGKGAVAALIGAQFGPDSAVLAGAGAMLGHSFPIWLGFRGGKGVATALGVLLAIAPTVGVIAALLWLATALLFRISSLAALVAIGAAPIAAYLIAWRPVYEAGRRAGFSDYLLADPQRAELAVFIALLVFLRHHANIRRLLTGKEPKIGQSQ